MKTKEARKELKKALKEVARDIRFYDHHDGKEVEIEPSVVEICNKTDCDAGRGCVHRVVKRSIVFCVY